MDSTNQLTGQALVWRSSDQSGVISALVHSVLGELLRGLPIRVIHQSTSQDAPVHESNSYGLGVWRIETADQLETVCLELSNSRSAFFDDADLKSVCIVFLEPELEDCVPVLLEVGAQIVVTDVPSLYQALKSLFPRPSNSEISFKVPLSSQGFHPLTSGLIERLPWPELGD